MNDIKIAIIGLGYVGLPLAIEFSKKVKTVGFDINSHRIHELISGNDYTLEVTSEELRNATQLILTDNPNDITECNYFIVTVPTPIDKHKKPDLTPLLKASETIGKILKKGDIVIYESTVYPGCTEEDCAPILEKFSNLTFNKDFFCGYSPERINPGDKEHTVTKILKITSGSTPEVAGKVDALYRMIILAGTHLASSIKIAEAAKVIENAQRDINISFINELALIFDRMNIDTHSVLEAASTKWNFLNYKPGLVGGHCIGIDPYYLTYKAESLGYYPQVIHSGRRINENMGIFVGNKVIKLMIKKGHKIEGARILVLGITFKENCPDIRNSRAIDVIHELSEFGCSVEVYDPWANKMDVKHEFDIDLIAQPLGLYDAFVLTVSHSEFKMFDAEKLKKEASVFYDVKGFWTHIKIDGRL